MSCHTACEFRRKLQTLALAALMVASLVAGAAAQAPDAHAPAADAHQAVEGDHAAPEEHGGEHGGLSGLIWPTINFLILCGGLYYFLRIPFTEYLTGRSSQIRKDLVDAAELNRTATAQLAEVDRKVKALPGESTRCAPAAHRRSPPRSAHRGGGGRRTRAPAHPDSPRDRGASARRPA